MSKSQTSSSSSQHTQSQSTTQSQQSTQEQSQQQSQSTTSQFLDPELLAQILGGLAPQMTDEQIMEFAENLLRPQLNAGLEAAQQEFEASQLGKQQEIENLAAELQRSVEAQQGAYRQNIANVETAALQRGMGRSSYTLDLLANQGAQLAQIIDELTRETNRKQEQLQAQITQAGEHNAQTQGRLNTDYAAQLAAKIQELLNQRTQTWNQNYLTALSSAMGETTTGQTTGTSTGQTTGWSQTDSSQQTDTSSSSSTVSSDTGGGGGSSYSSSSSSGHSSGTYQTQPGVTNTPQKGDLSGAGAGGSKAGGGGGKPALYNELKPF